MLTDADRQAYNAALEKCLGDKTAAAAVLGIPAKTFRQNLYNCAELRSRWAKKRQDVAPTSEDVETRKSLVKVGAVPVEPIQTPEEIEAAAVAADQALSSGLSKMPNAILTQNEKSLAEGLHAFQLRHCGAAAEIVGGSVSVASVKMTAALSELLERYGEITKDGAGGPQHYEGGAKNEAAVILESIPKFAAELRKLAEVVGKNNVNKALIALKAQQNAKGPGTRGKPGFKPLVAINVQPGGSVALGGQDGQK